MQIFSEAREKLKSNAYALARFDLVQYEVPKNSTGVLNGWVHSDLVDMTRPAEITLNTRRVTDPYLLVRVEWKHGGREYTKNTEFHFDLLFGVKAWHWEVGSCYEFMHYSVQSVCKWVHEQHRLFHVFMHAFHSPKSKAFGTLVSNTSLHPSMRIISQFLGCWKPPPTCDTRSQDWWKTSLNCVCDVCLRMV